MAAVSDSVEFVNTVDRLLDASDPKAAHRLLQRPPGLTSEEARLELTEMIARKRPQRDVWGMISLMTCRGLLQRCQPSRSVEEALAMQPGWPLRSQGPLNRLLLLPQNASADERTHWAELAQADVDPEQEPDFDGLIHYNLGWAREIEFDEGLSESLEEVIAHWVAAEEAWRQEGSVFDREWLGKVQYNLGRVYMQRRDGDRSQDIETALAWLHKAHSSLDETDTDKPDVLMLLGKAYLSRIQGERVYNVEQGIEWSEKALSLAQGQGSEEQMLGRLEHNLAIAYQLRARDSDARNIEEAKKLAERALKRLDPETSPEDWARTTLELATIYAHRQHGDRDENLETGIKYAKQALELYDPQEQPQQWTLAKLNLGNLYCDRVSGTRAENNRRGIRCFRDILRQCDKESYPLRWAEAMNNLGTVYASRRADWCGRNCCMAAKCYTRALEVRQPESLPFLARQTATNLGNLHFEHRNWPQARDGFTKALQATDLLYQAAATPEARQAELREMRNVPARLAYALCKMSAQEGDDPLQEAALTLEQNRARWLSEMLALYDDRPSDVPEETWQTFDACRERIRQLQAKARLSEDAFDRQDYLLISREMTEARTALGEAVSDVRKYDETFMPLSTFDQLQATTKPDYPLVYFAVSPAGTIALVVTPTVIHPVHTSLTEDALREHMTGITEDEWLRLSARRKEGDTPEQTINEVSGGYLGAYDRWRRDPRNRVTRATWFNTLDDITHWLWETLMGSVIEMLIDRGITGATLVPQGWLGLLPLHAAWTQTGNGRRYAIDDITFTYAPNARALAVANETAKRVPADGLFAIEEPDSVTATPLPNSTDEIAAICKHFAQRATLGGLVATHQATLKSLPHYPVLHFSCHGQARFRQPLEGGLVLADDEILTLRDILSLRLQRARLAVLSACETGVPGTDLPDEVISLPTGLTQAGVAGVVGSLWSVSDLSTMVLMARFYELWRQKGLSPPEALQQAQRWVRDTPNGEKKTYLEQSQPESQTTEDTSIYGANARHRRDLLNHPEAHGFEHPFHWAAFTYTGA